MWPLTIAGVIACLLARSTTRLVVSDHTVLSKHYASFGLFKRALLRLSIRLFYPRADARIAVSNAVAEDLVALSGVPNSRIEVIHNPVAGPPAGTVSKPRIDALWGAEEGRILSVGNLKSEKNHVLLIRSFARLLERRPAKLMILGEGTLRARLERLAMAQGVGDHVLFPGFRLDIWPYYVSADLFALSSNYEGFPLVLIEAMRCGLPIVSTDCPGGPSEILAGEKYGALVPPGDEEALAAALEKALASVPDPDLLRGRAEELSGNRTSERYLDLLLG